MGITGPGLTRMVKDRFLDMPGTATGIYISGLVTGATLGSWLTVPYLLQWVGSWSGTFLAWGGLALLALVGWVVLAPSAQAGRGERPPRLTGLWRDKIVWKLNIIFLSHNTFFYCAVSWTPTYYQELGVSLEEGTLLLTVFILMSLPSSLAIPYLSDRFGGRRSSLILSCIFLLLALLGMIFFPLAAPWVYFIVMGIASGGIFALEFALPLDYVESSQVGSVAGVNLLVGYCGAFLGPLLMGLIHDLTGTFLAGWLLVLAIMGVFLITTAVLPKKTVSQ
jgi:CP family cyanate transporter-like MFS transporter